MKIIIFGVERVKGTSNNPSSVKFSKTKRANNNFYEFGLFLYKTS